MRHTLRCATAITALLFLAGCQSTSPGSEVTAPPGEPGDVATWELVGSVTPDSTSFTAGVTRLGCAGGKTGTVLAPQVSYEDARIIVTIDVEALPDDMAYTCQTNDTVEVTVTLTEPVGERVLVDGACLESEAGGTSYCDDPTGVRG